MTTSLNENSAMSQADSNRSDLSEAGDSEFIEIIDVHAPGPSGRPCANCAATIEPSDHFCPACGKAAPNLNSSTDRAGSRESRAIEWIEKPTDKDAASVEAKHDNRSILPCKSCGAEIAIDFDQRSYQCAFCDATYVVDLEKKQTDSASPDRKTDGQRPEFVIGFAITRTQAAEIFEKWINTSGWFRPNDLRQARIVEKIQGVYIPFWSFSMLAESRWQCQIGEYWYRTETYTTTDANGKTVTRTRTITETEWWPFSAKHHQYYSQYLVSGSRGLPQKDANRVMPFNLPALKRYKPFYLAGWLSEEYSVSRSVALRKSQQVFYERECRAIAKFAPGDTYANLSVETAFSEINSDLCLLPFYLLNYKYRGRLYKFIINGQTGKAAGDKPWSSFRIGILVAVVFIVLLALLILFVIVFASQG